MALKQIKIIDPAEPDAGETVISINPDKVMQVRPVGEEDSEIILDGNVSLVTGYPYKQAVKWLS